MGEGLAIAEGRRDVERHARDALSCMTSIYFPALGGKWGGSMVEVIRCARVADTFSSVLRIVTKIVHFELILTDSCVGVFP